MVGSSSLPPLAGLILWILTTAPSFTTANFCTLKETTEVNKTSPCKYYLEDSILGWTFIPSRQPPPLSLLSKKDMMDVIFKGMSTGDDDLQCFFIKQETKEVTKCCIGYQGDDCTEAICTPPCENGGICADPQSCECPSDGRYTGWRCDNDQTLTGTNLGFCFTSDNCYGRKSNATSDGGVISSEDCFASSDAKSWGNGTNPEECISKNQTIHEYEHVVHTANLNYRTCVSSGPHYWRTLDGAQYEFSGQCEYFMFRNADSTIFVSVDMSQCTGFVSCSKTVKMSFSEIEYEAVGDNVVMIDSQQVRTTLELPASPENGVSFTEKNGYVYVNGKGIRVKWSVDGSKDIKLTIQQTYIHLDENDNEPLGLCGSYNQDPSDDFKTEVDSEPEKSPSLFATHFKRRNILNPKCKTGPYNPSCSSSPVIQRDARRYCNYISTSMFAECHSKVAWYAHFDRCVTNFCGMKRDQELGKDVTDDDIAEMLCNTFALYSSECSQSGACTQWRNGFFYKNRTCELTCKQDEIYTECGSSCPKTCTTMYHMIAESCFTEPEAGCQCELGKYLQDGKCVTPDECGCFYNNELYAAGSVVPNGCNKCTCDKARWTCTQDPCPKTCAIIGFTHIVTFDQTFFYTSSNTGCQYIMAESTGNEDSRFNIQIAIKLASYNTLNGKTYQRVGGITVTAGDYLFEVSVEKNGDTIALPDSTNGNIEFREASDLFHEIFGYGFTVLIARNRIYITLAPGFQTKGLCGTPDGQATNDMTNRNGIPESNMQAFMSGFSKTCDENAGHNNDLDAVKDSANCPSSVKSIVLSNCTAYVKELLNIEPGKCGLNAEIIRKHDQMCVADGCTAPNLDDINDALCMHAQALVFQCSLKGQYLDIQNNPNYDNLKEQCPEFDCADLIYRTDLPCKRTCKDVTMRSQCYLHETQISGCGCPDGTVLDPNNECIEQMDCPCYDHNDDSYYEPGTERTMNCRNCECINGEWICDAQECTDIQCPNNQEYISPESGVCPKTCLIYDRADECDYYGCGCPNGTAKNEEGACIAPEECPCYQGGQVFPTHSTTSIGCHKFVCENRVWIKDTSAEVDCPAVCIISGDPHYQTFDGTRYAFQGTCQYTAFRIKESDIQVDVENVACGSAGVSCTKSVTATLTNGRKVHMIRGQGVRFTSTIFEESESVSGPSETVDLSSGTWTEGGSNVTISQMGLWITLKTLEFTLYWDEGMRLMIEVHSSMKYRTEGLCGSYNDNSDDDFKSQADIVETAIQFADTWKVTSENCPPTEETESQCTETGALSHRLPWAQESCSVIKTGTLFETCRQKLQSDVVNGYYEECLLDSCSCDSGGDCECLCTAIANFGEECNRVGSPVRWRSQHMCPIQCDYGLVYQACAMPCESTCKDLMFATDEGKCLETMCLEGCYCPEGEMMEDGKCIPVTECPCYMENGERFEVGSSFTRTCMDCVCVSGKFECTPQLNCSECLESEFFCNISKQCVHDYQVCDGESDCDYNEDEENCERTCGPNEFQCDDGNCTDIAFKCDYFPDCADNSDESSELCIETCIGATCDNGDCIDHLSYICDGVPDCSDDSDEKNCTEECLSPNFRCSTGKCLGEEMLCDTHDDCGDGEDEAGCSTTSAPTTTVATTPTMTSTAGTSTPIPSTTPEF
ncbi:unnamed protein product, partial [Owenia fusiformis]